MTIDALLAFIATSILLSLAPGPDNLFVLTQAAIHGRKSGIWITLGLCSGLIVHTTAVALGVAAIVQSAPLVFTLLKVLGAGYLAYLAWCAWNASRQDIDLTGQQAAAPLSLFRRGVLMNITNPKVSIFFLAFLPQFANPDQGSMGLQLFYLGILFLLVALLVFSAIAIAAGTLGHWLTRSAKAQRNLNRMSAVVLAALAIRLATSHH